MPLESPVQLLALLPTPIRLQFPAGVDSGKQQVMLDVTDTYVGDLGGVLSSWKVNQQIGDLCLSGIKSRKKEAKITEVFIS